MRDTRDFAGKLGLALKALNISRGRLASGAQVDKSLVSRWLRGISAPRGHNLEAVTALVGASVAGFSQLSWELPIEAFGRLFGPEPAVAAEGAPPGWITQADLQATEQKAPAYEGFWRATHPSLTHPGGLLMHQYARIRREADGLLYLNIVAGLMGFNGPLVPVLDQLYAITRDPSDDTFGFVVFHGVIMPYADALDGLAMVPAKFQLRPICVFPYYMQRIGDLTGAREADDATLESLREAPTVTEDVSAELRRHLLRDVGSILAPGQAVMRLTVEASRSRGRSGGTIV
jgi:transcriptional regulator with XRE-family HTH domain